MSIFHFGRAVSWRLLIVDVWRKKCGQVIICASDIFFRSKARFFSFAMAESHMKTKAFQCEKVYRAFDIDFGRYIPEGSFFGGLRFPLTCMIILYYVHRCDDLDLETGEIIESRSTRIM